MRVQGWDLALNHGAVVELTDGDLSFFAYYTTIAGAAARSSEHGHRLPSPKPTDERQAYQMMRLAWIERWLDKVILVPRRPDFVGVEDYALRAEQGAHQLGEVGGIARILLWFRGTRFRLHDPISVKMFVTHDGTAQKDLIEENVRTRWGTDFGEFNAPAMKGKKENRTCSEDMADAFGIAKLVEAEAKIRAGTMLLSDLAHDKERQVFNRTTKTYPISLLGREWIHNPDGKFTPHGRFESCSSERCTLAVLDARGLLSKVVKQKLARVK